MHWAFNELIIQVVLVMLRELGVPGTLEAVRPRMHYSGKATARNFSARFGVQDTLEAIAYAPFCGRSLTWGGKGRLTLYERGATLEFMECPLRNGPPELCVITSHFLAAGICEEIDPDYEITYTQHMTQGDPRCYGICKKKNETGDDVGGLGERLRTLEDLDMGEEERDALSVNIEMSLLKMFVEGLFSNIPEERALQFLRPLFAEVGKQTGQMISMDRSEEMVELSILTALTWADMIGRDADLTEIENDAYELRLRGCLCCDSAPGVCVLMESFLAGIMSALDTRISAQFLRSTDDQDSHCRVLLTVHRPSHGNNNDPLLTLKMRLAKGEISEEEYLRKRTIILE